MTANTQGMRLCLKNFEFDVLFREHLGWDNHSASLDVTVDGETLRLTAVAQKRGFVAWWCPCIPKRATRLKIDHQITKSSREHFVIYADKEHDEQVWQWVRREPGKPLASRDHRYHTQQSGDRLIQRLSQIAVGLEEEEQITVVDVAGRARAAFDVDRVTKRFYDRFKAEHAAFQKLVKGIAAGAGLEWYTSLMLNRLMFVYFIQKKGFLDGDTDYLRSRLQQIQAKRGKDKFQSFYRFFLLRLFHDGLGKSPAERRLDPVLEKLLGTVPYLNGGFFEVHQLEESNPDIDIPDKAFEQLFDFFDQYSWHLDERPLRADNEINPDVVGYIFEKYVNQREMGAFYTKEDITEYICKNTIIPFLFSEAEKTCSVAFRPAGALWRLLRDNPDRYIYPAMRHGVISTSGDVISLPPEIAAGQVDATQRDSWNRMADGEYGAANETWREFLERRHRCLELRERLQAGQLSSLPDCITANLDVWQFARDAIANAEGPDLLRAFWHALEKMTVLDPTCGSGAFLFAALRVLETLYSDCLERMEGFVEDLKGKDHHPEQYRDFKNVLASTAEHPNQRYFILKAIIVNNLYGVDVMEEAVEICKLRLFLKLVAQLESARQIEPLPDLDFNIRAGNTLVGFTSLEEVRRTQSGKLGFEDEEIQRVEEDAASVEQAFAEFRRMQTARGGRASAKQKRELRARFAKLDEELNRYLAGDYGVSVENKKAFADWKAKHEPFHWFVDFYGIMQRGGFDVIVGNPPYLELRQVDYSPRGFKTHESGAIHAMCVERSLRLLRSGGAISMIVPLALVSTQRMTVVQQQVERDARVWYANFSWRPGKLFDTVNRALTIFVGCHGSPGGHTYSTRYQKWNSDARDQLMSLLAFCEVPRERGVFWVPKLGAAIEREMLAKMMRIRTRVADVLARTPHEIFYRTTGGLYWKVFTDFAPAFKCNGKAGHSSRETAMSVREKQFVVPVIAALSSDVFWWWYTVTSNLRDLNPSDIHGFPLPAEVLKDKQLASLGQKYLNDLQANSTMKVRQQRQTGKTETQSFKIQKSKALIERIDDAMAPHYGLTDSELDFIKNYDIKYRMGIADGDEDGDE